MFLSMAPFNIYILVIGFFDFICLSCLKNNFALIVVVDYTNLPFVLDCLIQEEPGHS